MPGANMLIWIALGALLIWMMFNSRRKQKARQEEIANNLVPGAKVMTGSGIFGTVVAVDDENGQVTIESGPGTQLIVHRQAIGQIEAPAVLDAPAEPEAPAVDEPPTITDAELDAHNEAKRESGENPDKNPETTK